MPPDNTPSPLDLTAQLTDQLTDKLTDRSRAASATYRWPVLAVLAVLLALGSWWDSRNRLSDLEAELSRRVAEATTRHDDIRLQERTDHDALQALQTHTASLESRLAETAAQASALETVYRDVTRSRDERVLADVEQIIAIAAQQLQLAGNVEVALLALQGADTRLGASAQSRFVPLRRLIARDIERLKAQPLADLGGVSLKIESVVSSIDTLPLASERRPEPASRPAKGSTKGEAAANPQATAAAASAGRLEHIATEVWHELKQLIRVERTDQHDPVLLPPGQAYFLRENLRLRLLSARLALLQREGGAYRNDLRQSKELIERYFDTQAKPVQTALSVVTRLVELNPGQELPALNETLSAARNLKLPAEKVR